MKTETQIELWLTREMGSKIWVEYTISDEEGQADVSQELRTSDVLSFVKDAGLNWQYIGEPDELIELDAETYMRDNLGEVVKVYLMTGLEVAA